MILSSLFCTNISAPRAAPGVCLRLAAGAASGTRGGGGGLAGPVVDGTGFGSGYGTELGVTCGFEAGSATGCGLCGCGEDAPAPGACRDGADDGHTAAMALFALVIAWRSHDMRPGFGAGAFATTLAAGGFGVVLATGCAFATGFAEGWAFA